MLRRALAVPCLRLSGRMRSPPAGPAASLGVMFVLAAANSSRLFATAAAATYGRQGISEDRVAEEVKALTAAVRRSWKKPSKEELQARGLTALEVAVTQRDGTEPPFKNKYWDNHRAGIYLDVVSGEPLYCSLDKFDSGTGWPSFTRTLPGVELRSNTDYHTGYARNEMRSPIADSHLGHIFPDGPRDRGGMRHCANSASLRFVPAEEMDADGFGELRKLLFSDVSSSKTEEL
eukprot:TRINITY_DN121296_c0_g1_i1.p1 TRINITY_DN121296_c0_g1~~TRINITY_DN121296_c0_g1_i1.p1  ORF type:complete len:233 (-),score=24.10 TRINITY_DN121296_c0_g1_i1:149-847(-)